MISILFNNKTIRKKISQKRIKIAKLQLEVVYNKITDAKYIKLYILILSLNFTTIKNLSDIYLDEESEKLKVDFLYWLNRVS